MKYAIVGSRNFNDYELLKTKLSEYDITYIVSGGASGADSLAEKYAKEFDIPIFIYYPEWERYGKKAGFVRNKLIVDASDVIIAFWDGISRGTSSTINYANQVKKTVIVVDITKGEN